METVSCKHTRYQYPTGAACVGLVYMMQLYKWLHTGDCSQVSSRELLFITLIHTKVTMSIYYVKDIRPLFSQGRPF